MTAKQLIRRRVARGGLVVLLSVALMAGSASAKTVEFKPPTDQSFDVPSGVTQLEVVSVGGSGEKGGFCELFSLGGFGGSGAKVTATLTVSAGQKLNVRFGGG